MPNERLSDALKMTRSQPEPQKDPKNHKMAKRVAYVAACLAIVAGVGVGVSVINHDNQTTDKRAEQDQMQHARDTEKEKQQDIYKNLSKQKIQVEAADKAVTAMVKDKTAITEKRDNKPSDETLNKAVQTAEDKVKAIQGDDEDLKSIRTAYTDIINVVKNPSLDNLQTAKTAIHNMEDTDLSRHLSDANVTALTKVVATVNHMPVSDVENATKPLTAQQQQAKAAAAAKAKADAEAKASSSVAAKSSSQATPSAQSTNAPQAGASHAEITHQAPAQNAAPAQSTQRSTAPAAKSHYTAPANNTPRYSAPASRASAPAHAASNNQAAQKAASSAQVPADTVDRGWGLTGANGEPLDWGSW
ncbi:Peptidoglycan-binding LysM [Ligilactobacillus ruminis DPC 6832]|uniref:Peptidoglycan-binding LysM n=1 Tax=Ligilactobacillus ruminis DPC 6832 TaxID=1402208 RepID=A0A837DWG7_9LACO|nr:hypothetical protein [Ligilactobacillus ruminis]KIC05306.1 Peptidoglycan-binding LysM [Ligilactobacillus ruminis DPC 6832]